MSQCDCWLKVKVCVDCQHSLILEIGWNVGQIYQKIFKQFHFFSSNRVFYTYTYIFISLPSYSFPISPCPTPPIINIQVSAYTSTCSYPSIYLPMYLSFRISVYLSIHLSIHLFFYISYHLTPSKLQLSLLASFKVNHHIGITCLNLDGFLRNIISHQETGLFKISHHK